MNKSAKPVAPEAIWNAFMQKIQSKALWVASQSGESRSAYLTRAAVMRVETGWDVHPALNDD